MKNNIFLIGYRGTGKTTIGKILAQKAKLDFVDTDEEIVKLSKKLVPEIFKTEGEKSFRDYESVVLKNIISKNNQVISCGGGIVEREENRKLIKNNGLVVLLTSKPEIIFERINKDPNRPALTNKDPYSEIISMISKRKPLYDEIKDFEIDTSIDGKARYAKIILNFYQSKQN